MLPGTLTFLQAPDGCLHAVFGPSGTAGAEPDAGGQAAAATAGRSAAPQAPIAARAASEGQEPLPALARRLCVNP